MKIFFIYAISLLISLFNIGFSHAFSFDIWKSGMTKRQIHEIGKKNKIRFRDGGRSYGKHMILQNKIEYNDELLGEQANVNLVFTKQTNILSSISIRWNNVKTRNRIDDLVATLRIELPKKYGTFNKRHSSAMSICNGKKCTGKTESYMFDDNQSSIYIYYTKCNSCVSLSYKDKQLEKMYDHEIELERIKEKNSLEKF